MAQIEELLQQLIDIQKEEMRRTRRYRIMKFVWVTLPFLVFLILSVWGSVAFYQSLQEMVQNNPNILNIPGFGSMNGL